eukprot:PhM_4_TR1261/c0_g2_i1/m.31677
MNDVFESGDLLPVSFVPLESSHDYEEQRDTQNGVCRGCNKPLCARDRRASSKIEHDEEVILKSFIPPQFSPTKTQAQSRPYFFCHYTGCLFCPACFSNGATCPVPGNVLQHWDWAPKPVCNAAHRHIQRLWSVPCMDVSALHPHVIASNVAVKLAVALRHQLAVAFDACRGCAALDTELAELSRRCGVSSVLWEHESLYSMRDLSELRATTEESLRSTGSAPRGFIYRLKQVRTLFGQHATEHHCIMCHARVHVPCYVCEDVAHPVTIFDTNNVVYCPQCRLACHKRCGAPCPCPRDASSLLSPLPGRLASLSPQRAPNEHTNSQTTLSQRLFAHRES